MDAPNPIIDASSSEFDNLSALLRLLKFEVEVYHNAKVCGDWRITEHEPGATCFHIVTLNSVRLEVPGHLRAVLNSGDVVIFPRELPHSMVSAVPMEGEQRALTFRRAAEVDGTGLICGAVRFQHQASHFVLDALPAVFVVRYEPANGWSRSMHELFLAESFREGPASKAIIERLSELLFTFALRQHLVDHPGQTGLLSLYAHPRLARAIHAFHEHPGRDWTLDALAREAALSRSTFADTFKLVCGWTPGRYLTWWRMQLAWSMLNRGESAAAVAAKVGYRSESAFSRAFRNCFGTVAGKIRRAAVRSVTVG